MECGEYRGCEEGCFGRAVVDSRNVGHELAGICDAHNIRSFIFQDWFRKFKLVRSYFQILTKTLGLDQR